jgi:hypothetical protein
MMGAHLLYKQTCLPDAGCDHSGALLGGWHHAYLLFLSILRFNLPPGHNIVDRACFIARLDRRLAVEGRRCFDG